MENKSIKQVFSNKLLFLSILSKTRFVNLCYLRSSFLNIYGTYDKLVTKSLKYHQCNNIEWLCSNKYFDLLWLKLVRDEPLVLNKTNLKTLVQTAPLRHVEFIFNKAIALPYYSHLISDNIITLFDEAVSSYRPDVVKYLWNLVPLKDREATARNSLALAFPNIDEYPYDYNNEMFPISEDNKINKVRPPIPDNILELLNFMVENIGPGRESLEFIWLGAMFTRHAQTIRFIIKSCPKSKPVYTLSYMLEKCDYDSELAIELLDLPNGERLPLEISHIKYYVSLMIRKGQPIALSQMKLMEYIVRSIAPNDFDGIDQIKAKILEQVPLLNPDSQIMKELIYLQLAKPFIPSIDKAYFKPKLENIISNKCVLSLEYLLSYLEEHNRSSLPGIGDIICCHGSFDQVMYMMESRPTFYPSLTTVSVDIASSFEILEYLVNKGMSCSIIGLEYMVKMKKHKEAKLMLKLLGESLNDNTKYSLLPVAFENDDLEMVDLLLQANVNRMVLSQSYVAYFVAKHYTRFCNVLEIQPDSLQYLMSSACYYGFLDTVKEVHRIHPSDFNRNDALDYALMASQEEVVEYLIAHRSDTFSIQSWTICGMVGDIDMFTKFVIKRSGVSQLYETLSMAYTKGNLEFIKAMVEQKRHTLDHKIYTRKAVTSNQQHILTYYLEKVKPPRQDVIDMFYQESELIHPSTWKILFKYVGSFTQREIEAGGDVFSKNLEKLGILNSNPSNKIIEIFKRLIY